MSRSYRKFIVCKDSNSKFGKRSASRTVRHAENVPNGGCFKRFYCPWIICDYRSKGKFYTAEEFRRKWFDKSDEDFYWWRKHFRVWKDAYRHWLKWYRMK